MTEKRITEDSKNEKRTANYIKNKSTLLYCWIDCFSDSIDCWRRFLLHNLEKDEKTTGKYMAQITEKRVRARLDQYSMPLLFWEIISVQERIWMRIHFLNWQKRFLMKME